MNKTEPNDGLTRMATRIKTVSTTTSLWRRCTDDPPPKHTRVLLYDPAADPPVQFGHMCHGKYCIGTEKLTPVLWATAPQPSTTKP